MDTYARVAKSVEPKKQALAQAEKQVYCTSLKKTYIWNMEYVAYYTPNSN